jgi:hypothetical protein
LVDTLYPGRGQVEPFTLVRECLSCSSGWASHASKGGVAKAKQAAYLIIYPVAPSVKVKAVASPAAVGARLCYSFDPVIEELEEAAVDSVDTSGKAGQIFILGLISD